MLEIKIRSLVANWKRSERQFSFYETVPHLRGRQYSEEIT
jgi:hypothetical protein